MQPAEGGCLCGAVRYQISTVPTEITLCHCKQCRKAQGAAFAANAPMPAEDFEFLPSSDKPKIWQATPQKERLFCGNCGSPILSRRIDLPNVIRLRIGTLDVDPEVKIAQHIYVDSKACWWEIADDAPQFAELPTAD